MAAASNIFRPILKPLPWPWHYHIAVVLVPVRSLTPFPQAVHATSVSTPGKLLAISNTKKSLNAYSGYCLQPYMLCEQWWRVCVCPLCLPFADCGQLQSQGSCCICYEAAENGFRASKLQPVHEHNYKHNSTGKYWKPRYGTLTI